MTSAWTMAYAIAATPSTGDDTPLLALSIVLALALCVLTFITCWRVFSVTKNTKKEPPHERTATQKPQKPQDR